MTISSLASTSFTNKSIHASTLNKIISLCTQLLPPKSALKTAIGTTRRNHVWFKEKGLKFKCTACGKCCTGKGGKVWANNTEIELMAEELEMKVEEFKEQYMDNDNIQMNNGTEGNQKLKSLKMINDKCIFLNETNHQCTLYGSRPTQCRTFPWWPQVVSSEFDWKVAATYCEGIEHPSATTISHEEIMKNLVVHNVHRSGEEDSFVYDHMMEYVSEIDEQLIDEFEDDFVQNHAREILFEDDQILILNNRMGLSRPSRSLHFKNSLNYNQSEIFVDGNAKKLNHDKLTFDVHEALCLACVWLLPSPIKHIAVIGTGAGAIPMFLHGNFPEATIDCVDSSPQILHLAQKYFGLKHTTPFRILHQTGETYVSPHQLDCLIIDVATESGQVPPESMLEDSFVHHIKGQMQPDGIVVMNVVVSNKDNLIDVVKQLHRHFNWVRVFELSNNCVLYASNSTQDRKTPPPNPKQLKHIGSIANLNPSGTWHNPDDLFVDTDPENSKT